MHRALFIRYQDADRTRDREFVTNVNKLLADPNTIPIWYAAGYTPHDPEETTPAPQASTSAQPRAGPSTAVGEPHEPTAEELANVRQLISSIGSQPQAGRTGTSSCCNGISSSPHILPRIRISFARHPNSCEPTPLVHLASRNRPYFVPPPSIRPSHTPIRRSASASHFFTSLPLSCQEL